MKLNNLRETCETDMTCKPRQFYVSYMKEARYSAGMEPHPHSEEDGVGFEAASGSVVNVASLPVVRGFRPTHGKAGRA